LDPNATSNEIKLAKPQTASRTVEVTGIAEGTTKAQLEKKARKVGPIEQIEFPVSSAADTAYILYKTMEEAVEAAQKLDGAEIQEKKPIAARVFSTAKLRQFRVIVRNLPWNCTEENLQAMFLKYGKIYEVKLPPGKRAGSSAGFGFVNFTNQTDAEKAIREANAQELGGRKIAVDWAVAREQYQEALAAQKTNQPPTAAASSSAADADAMDVDSTVNSDKPVEGEEKGDDDNEEGAEDDDEDEEDDDDEDDGSEPEADDKPKEDDKPKKQHATDIHLGKTLFIRNLAYATTEEALREKFSTWGKLRYAVLVKNKQTGESIGSAFLQFSDPSDAQKCLDDAYASKAFKTARQRINARDNESDILLDGRRLIVTKAVTREQASEYKDVGDDHKKKRDPRNLALAGAGVVSTSAGEESGLTADEIARRQRGEHNKKMKVCFRIACPHVLQKCLL
jgi:nucleolar protein 4